MKTGKEFRIPLSKEAIAVIKQAQEFERDDYLFPSIRKGVISDATMSRFMDRRGLTARPHGFRSSFRNWCAEVTDVPREVAETALSHSYGSQVELSYRRTDYLDRRIGLMQQWADFVSTGQVGDVVQLVASRQIG
jgi:integrase